MKAICQFDHMITREELFSRMLIWHMRNGNKINCHCLISSFVSQVMCFAYFSDVLAL